MFRSSSPARPYLLPCLLSCLLLAAGAAHGVVSPVAGTGILDYRIVKDGLPPSCAGEGPFVVTYDGAARLTVSGGAAGCAPIFATISGCVRAADGTVVCDKRIGDETIVITMAPDGGFDYEWDAPEFREKIMGRLDRVG